MDKRNAQDNHRLNLDYFFTCEQIKQLLEEKIKRYEFRQKSHLQDEIF